MGSLQTPSLTQLRQNLSEAVKIITKNDSPAEEYKKSIQRWSESSVKQAVCTTEELKICGGEC
jgi:hypothetical protein